MSTAPASASLRRRRALYLVLLAVQSLCVTVLVVELLPFFWRVVDELGEVQDVSAWDQAVAWLCVVVFQGCYWWRIKHLAVPFATRSQLLAHLFQFVGRLSFIFASTVTSIVFFRHVPLLTLSSVTVASVFRFVLFLAMLFTWFCFALELERLGKRQSRT
jgi:hypothetical protein